MKLQIRRAGELLRTNYSATTTRGETAEKARSEADDRRLHSATTTDKTSRVIAGTRFYSNASLFAEQSTHRTIDDARPPTDRATYRCKHVGSLALSASAVAFCCGSSAFDRRGRAIGADRRPIQLDWLLESSTIARQRDEDELNDTRHSQPTSESRTRPTTTADRDAFDSCAAFAPMRPITVGCCGRWSNGCVAMGLLTWRVVNFLPHGAHANGFSDGWISRKCCRLRTFRAQHTPCGNNQSN